MPPSRMLACALLICLAGCSSGGGSIGGNPDGPSEKGLGFTVTPSWSLDQLKEPRAFQGHTAPIEQVAISEDGRIIRSFSPREWAVRVWDVEGGKEGIKRDIFPDEWENPDDPNVRAAMEQQSRITGLVFFPDMKRCLLGTARYTRNPEGTDTDWAFEYRIWNLETGKVELQFEGDPGAWESLALSPDAKQALSAGPDGIQLWDLATGKSLKRSPAPSGKIQGLAFSADGAQAVGTVGKDVFVWGLAGDAEPRRLSGHEQPPVRVATSAKGQAISAGHDGLVRLWDLAAGKEVSILGGHGGLVRGLAFSRDGHLAASAGGGQDHTVRVWDVTTGQQRAAFTDDKGGIRALAFSADGKWLVSGGDDQVVRLRRIPAAPASPAPTAGGDQSGTKGN